MSQAYTITNESPLPEKKSSYETNVDVNVPVEEEVDPWALPEFKGTIVPWDELTTCKKVERVLWHYIGKVLLLLAFLYIFICSLSFLGDAFKLLGGKTAGEAFRESEVLSNPVAGLMLGVLGTVLLQSSSTTTSIVVSMVGSEILSVRLAIPIVMGANIGTSVTNTIVSLGQITDKDDFRRAFAGATVHDAFNWLTVLILLPLELLTHYLERLSGAIIDSLHIKQNEGADQDYLKVITNPLTKLVIQIDKKVITKIATGELNDTSKSIIKHECKNEDDSIYTCKFMFEHISSPEGGNWSDTVVGVILLLIALFLLCICLVCIVKILHSLLQGQIAFWIRKFVNTDLPGRCSYFTGYLAIVVGAGITILVQSSSIFTSSITPLVGMGVISLERMYPLTLGSNIGTTATSVIAAFAQDESKISNSLQIALCHLFFNISGIAIFYPFPFFRPPINAAKFLGTRTEKYRWFAIVYLILVFFLLPALVFGISYWSWIALTVVLVPVGLVILFIAIVKCFQDKRPLLLPSKLQNWKWLPHFMRSLEPMDRGLMFITGNCFLCRKCGCCKTVTDADDVNRAERIEAKTLDGVDNTAYAASREQINVKTAL